MTTELGHNHSQLKRDQFLDYTRTCLVPHRAVQGVVVIGSVASGFARPDSDIDAVVFMEPFDPYIAPAESLWRASDNTHHSIFSDDPTLDQDGIQLDLHRLDLARWRSAEHSWPEHTRAELADGWIVFDRTAEIAKLIKEQTSMSESARLVILDEVLVEVAGLLPEDPFQTWRQLGPTEAFDRLQAVWEALARGLFGYNKKWRPWRSRSIRNLMQVEYLPDALRIATGAAASSGDGSLDGYRQRADLLKAVAAELLDRLRRDGAYGPDAIGEAFRRLHDEPGRAWNMDEWNRNRRTH
ncbi:MAG: nucleotidyltransferase domain-containing protein [Nakamurella sp.]